MEGMLENLTGGGVNSSGNPDGSGNTSLKVTFDFTDVSIASVDKFSKNCFVFSNFIILSSYIPPTTFVLSFYPYAPLHSVFVTFVEATCDNLKISRKVAYR